jgi:hypothetical protein
MKQSDPYVPPQDSSEPNRMRPRNRLATVSLTFSVVSLVAFMFVTVRFIAPGMLLAIPGLISGLVAARKEPCRTARLSVLIAGFVCLYIPTILHVLIYAQPGR